MRMRARMQDENEDVEGDDGSEEGACKML